MVRRFGKVDANQDQIVSALRAAGASVQSLASLGKGVPDLLVALDGSMWLIEVKGEKGKLTPDQVEWIAAWHGPVHVIRGVDEVLTLVGVIGD